jgi:putative ABC transport system permease protein
MESLLHDLRLGVRSLRKDRGFTLMAIVTLAVGIGAATALFSVAYGVLLRPLPYPEPNRIVQLWEVSEQGNQNNVSDPNFADWAEQSRSFGALAQFGVGSMSVVGGAEPVWQQAASVSRDFFTVMGVQPVIGRGFVPEEQQMGGPPAVIVSHTFWRDQLGGTLDLGGRTLRFGDHDTYTVVGVMPPGFDFPAGAALWTPRELHRVSSVRLRSSAT